MDYQKQAEEFLSEANASMKIDYVGEAVNQNWKEDTLRPLYEVTIFTPRGHMSFKFWDSIHNLQIMRMSLKAYAEKRYNLQFHELTTDEIANAKSELEEKKNKAHPTPYDVLACMQKYDPETFEEFCSEFGYDEDSRSAERIYIGAMQEYKQLARIFSEEEMEKLREIE